MIKTGIYGQFDGQTDILENIFNVAELKVLGWYTSETDNQEELFDNLRIKKYSGISSLINEVDAVIAFSPMSNIADVEFFVKNSKHVFFEPSSIYSNEDLLKLVSVVDEANVKVQAAFHYRFNNTFLAAKPFIKFPKFIQSNNFKTFNSDTKSSSVLLDMLKNDIDIVLSVVKSNIKKISANATSVSSKDPDIIDTRIEFMNGSVAQLTVGRISTENSHIINFYCPKNYVNIDFYNNKVCQIKKRDANNDIELFSENIGDLIVVPIPTKNNNQYYDELSSFANAIVHNKTPEVDFETLIKTYRIIDEIERQIKFFCE
ncbi:hypothetical protein LJC11_01130 [Bacteroidales bacterium OttesenSCG-928-I21]|nr:hypothetical protein [Bacteroidales bacterium OttesenSCG-928-I21]